MAGWMDLCERKCFGSLAHTFTVMCIWDVMSLRAATITSLHFLVAKWQLTSRAYLSRSVESPCRNSMSFRDVSNSPVSLITWSKNRSALVNKRRQLGEDETEAQQINCCLTRTALYSSSWLLLSGMLWRRHSLIMHCEISSQISSPRMDESFFSPMDTSVGEKTKNKYFASVVEIFTLSLNTMKLCWGSETMCVTLIVSHCTQQVCVQRPEHQEQFLVDLRRRGPLLAGLLQTLQG